jgi:hypothetical protein
MDIKLTGVGDRVGEGVGTFKTSIAVSQCVRERETETERERVYVYMQKHIRVISSNMCDRGTE